MGFFRDFVSGVVDLCSIRVRLMEFCEILNMGTRDFSLFSFIGFETWCDLKSYKLFLFHKCKQELLLSLSFPKSMYLVSE